MTQEKKPPLPKSHGTTIPQSANRDETDKFLVRPIILRSQSSSNPTVFVPNIPTTFYDPFNGSGALGSPWAQLGTVTLPTKSGGVAG